eukprot:CAMPEP_0198419282 /NCGR_PEP_ID=MMETSP1452-20131203/108_1 /TAXON_ID=1181717 /ORGANISM="Synchroma pusillum, Strain CCMP3072" /LENGTH=188 /DNA_ID=CAMNT_0044139407 /DNA_START=45 /DNA_END=611 /DNA_ORIENTATION=-
MSDFGELVLVLGDIHQPARASAIPAKFQKMLVPGKIHHVLCTGNLVSREVYDELRSLAPNVHVVRGDFDDGVTFPESKTVQIGQWKLGLLHGHQVVPWGDPSSLAAVARSMDVDVLVSGHTHKNEISELEGRFYVNPGSITGSYSSVTTEVTPSFMLLAIQGPKIQTFVYELKPDGELEVSRSEITKS